MYALVKERMAKLDQQENNLEMVQLKLYSFHHYLRKINFKGFAKWSILNQCVKELHPQGLSLIEIIKINQENQRIAQTGATPNHELRDDIYVALKSHYQDSFMNLTPSEEKSIEVKKYEYQTLLQNSVYITHILMNMST